MNNILGNAAYYSEETISTSELDLSTYVTTDSLLANKQGKCDSVNLPPNSEKCTRFKKGDILVANIRPYLKKIWLANIDGGCSADVLVFRAKEEYLSNFLYYALLRDDFFIHSMKGSTGTKMPRGNKNHLLEFLIPDFDDIQQEKISDVLSILDAKINLNNQINIELETMAKLIYDYWFVQFDFPDENGRPYKSSGGKMIYNEDLKKEIPEGWSSIPISNLLNIKTGKEDANFATSHGKYPFFTCGENILRCDDYAFEGKAILLAGNGTFGVKRYIGKFNAYQRTYVLIPYEEDHFPLIYHAVNAQAKQLTDGSRGSIVKFITIGDVKDIKLVLPNNPSVLSTGLLSNFFNQSDALVKENEELIRIRDWLLPMLMNGQVTVSEAS